MQFTLHVPFCEEKFVSGVAQKVLGKASDQYRYASAREFPTPHPISARSPFRSSIKFEIRA